jgi:hypothetical protein
LRPVTSLSMEVVEDLNLNVVGYDTYKTSLHLANAV